MNQFLSKIQYLLLAVAIPLAVACSSDAPESGDRGVEMRFSTAGNSRTLLSSDLAFEGSQFAVYGDMKRIGASAPGFVLFNGVPVTYTNSEWTYSNTQYWIPDYEYAFVGVYPAAAAGISSPSYSDGRLSCNFSLAESYADTPDLLVATHRRTYEGKPFDDTSTPPVTLNFVHALSRVNFLVKCDGAAAQVLIKEVKIEGVKKSGSFVVAPAALTEIGNMTGDYTLSWTPSDDSQTLVAPTDVEVPDGEGRYLFPDDNALLVIPQPDNEAIIVKMAYTLIYKNGKTQDRSLTAAPIRGWEPEKSYTYSLTLEPTVEEIELNVSVDDWVAGPTIPDVTVPRK